MNQSRALTTVFEYEGMRVSIPASTPFTDRLFVASWLQSKRSPHTQLNYRIAMEQFFAWMQSDDRDNKKRSITELILPDLQAYESYIKQLYPGRESTQAAKLSAVKSMWTFGHRQGVLKYNLPAAIPIPRGEDKLAERILTHSQVYALIDTARRMGVARDHVLIVLLYASAIRCEEACNLRWRDVQVSDHGNGQITVTGKRRKTRTILLHPTAWNLLQSLKSNDSLPDDHVFRSREIHLAIDKTPTRRLDESSVWRIVKKIAAKAGINASTHFFRHSHATHMMHKKVSYDVIMETMGQSDIRAFRRYLHAAPNESSSLHIDL